MSMDLLLGSAPIASRLPTKGLKTLARMLLIMAPSQRLDRKSFATTASLVYRRSLTWVTFSRFSLSDLSLN